LFGEDALRNAVSQFVAHYHFERNQSSSRQSADHCAASCGSSSWTSATKAAVRRLAELLPSCSRVSIGGPGMINDQCSSHGPDVRLRPVILCLPDDGSTLISDPCHLNDAYFEWKRRSVSGTQSIRVFERYAIRCTDFINGKPT